MEKNNNSLALFLLAMLFMAYLYVSSQNGKARAEEQRIKDSIALDIIKKQQAKDSLNMTLLPDTSSQAVVNIDSLKDLRLVLDYGNFAMSATGEETQHVLENDKVRFTFSNKGGRIIETKLKDFKKSVYVDRKKVESELVLLEDERNKFGFRIPVNGVDEPVSTEDLYFKVVESSPSKIVFRAFANSADNYIEQVYSLKGDYQLDYDLNLNGLSRTIPSGTTDFELDWVNYLDRIEQSTEYESSLSTIYFKASNKDYSYCSCRGNDEVTKDKPMDWIAHSNQFFNTTLIAETPFKKMDATIEAIPKEEGDLKRLQTKLLIPNQNNFGMTIYSGPNEYKRLAKFDNDLEYIIPYGRSILGTINRWFIRPLFNFFGGFVGSIGIVIIIVTFLVKMALFPFTYKMLYSQAKMQALKPKLEVMKKRLGDDQKQIQVEQMKLYRETGVNPLGGCLPMLIQMPIWIALYRFFPAAIEFRQESFLWASDLASYDVFAWLPWEGGIWQYGKHISMFTILWAVSTMIYTYYNSKHMDMSANPAMKYVQYLMPFTFLFFFNSMAAGLTCYMFFSSLINITQTLVTKHFIIDHKKVAKELEDYKQKPKKEGGFRDRLSKALEEAQKAQEEQQKQQAKKKKKK